MNEVNLGLREAVDLEEMQVINIGGDVILGTFKEGVITEVKVYQDEGTRFEICEDAAFSYLKDKVNNKLLANLEVGNAAYTARHLTDDEKFAFETALRRVEFAEKTAVGNLVMGQAARKK